jgi:hypothetical protein
MGYKILGFAVWQGVKWYLRGRLQGSSRKLALVGVGGVLLAAGAVAAQRQRASS